MNQKTIAELIDRKVIAPVDEPTTWCTQSRLKRVRLVTDFTALNKFVRRPTHPFPSTQEIIEAIPPDAKLFCKLDAVHGYFQLALDESLAGSLPSSYSRDVSSTYEHQWD